VQAALHSFKLTPPRVIVIYDEIDCRWARSRQARRRAPAAITAIRRSTHISAADYWRVRWAVDHPGSKELVKAYCWMDFSRKSTTVQAVLDAVADAILYDRRRLQPVHEPRST